MRSRVLQACRPLRASSPSTQCLRTASSRTPTSRPASSFSKQYAIPRATTYSRTTPQKPKPPSSASNGVIDPQAAIPPATTVTDVDPTLANQIPTPDNTTPSPAFASALASGPTISNGAENGEAQAAIDWSSSFHGLSTTPFSAETANVLMKELDPYDIEIKPDGIIYLPEIKYRRILNRAFGPGGWGLAPRGELVVGEKVVTREYALVVHGRFIAQARGECQYFSEETIPTAGEGCKSNALLRCCKDLGIASELWDPRFIRDFKKAHCQEIWVEHIVSKKRRQIWTRKDSEPGYPYQLVKAGGRA